MERPHIVNDFVDIDNPAMPASDVIADGTQFLAGVLEVPEAVEIAWHVPKSYMRTKWEHSR